MPKITILPAGKSAWVEAGLTLIEAGKKAGVEMEAGCFSCFCGTCIVEIASGAGHLEAPKAEELDVLDSWHKDPEYFRLACCARLRSGEVAIRAKH